MDLVRNGIEKKRGHRRKSMSDVGEKIIAGNSNWSFKGKVAKNFTRHIKKSVPLYEEGHNLICRISDFFVPDDSLYAQNS